MPTAIGLLIFGLLALLWAAHLVGRKIPPSSKQMGSWARDELQSIAKPKKDPKVVKSSEDAYAALFDVGKKEFTGWKVERIDHKEYRRPKKGKAT